MMKRMKKTAIIVSIVVGVLILAAVAFGILNATVGNGEWTFGWIDYRYDETGYEIGNGSVSSADITRIDLDWIDGTVTIVACQDAYVSISETSKEGIPEASQVRWHLSEDGTTLTVKYRESSQFFGFGSAKCDKDLILRVPERFFDNLDLRIHVESTQVRIENITAAHLDFESETGNLKTLNCSFVSIAAESDDGSLDLDCTESPIRAELTTDEGDIYLRLPRESAYTLRWDTDNGRINSDFTYRIQNGQYTVGTGDALLIVETDGGDLFLIAK